MKNKKLILIVALSLATTIAIVFGIIKIISGYKSNEFTFSIPVPPQAVNRSVAYNENGYFTYLLEGYINDVISTTPLTLKIAIRTDKILPDYTEPLIKTITLKEGATVILRDLVKNNESTISAYTTLKKDDDIAVWLTEPNTKILEQDNFTVTKIVINK